MSSSAAETRTSANVEQSVSARLTALFTGTMGPLIGLVLLCLVLSVATDNFLSLRNFLNVLDQITVLGIMAIGMTLVILIGGIDLSVGSVLALAAMVLGFVSHPDYLNLGVPVGIVAALVAGAICGLVSGLLVTVARLPPFIATLAMMSVARGLANIVTDGSQIIGFPGWFTDLSIVRNFGFLSATVAAMLVLTALFAAFLDLSRQRPQSLRHWWQRRSGAPVGHSRKPADQLGLCGVRRACGAGRHRSRRPPRFRAAQRRRRLRTRHYCSGCHWRRQPERRRRLDRRHRGRRA